MKHLTVLSSLVLLCQPGITFASTILGTAQNFAVLGASTVTNTGSTIISGNLGVYPGSAITGFTTIDAGPGIVVNGSIHITDAVAQQAQIDEALAFKTLGLLPSTMDESGTDLAGLTLTPGVYSFTSSAALNGTLTLDFLGNPNALFVFQIGSTLITGSNASVQVINGVGSDGIFWKVGSSATLGSGTTFAGNILALDSITLVSGSKIECGRALAQMSAVTMDSNLVSDDCAVDNFASSRSDFGSTGFSSSNIPLATPEPTTVALLGIGLAFLLTYSTCKRKMRHAYVASNLKPATSLKIRCDGC